MKKILIILSAALMLFNVGCKEELENDFVNPEIYSPTANVPSGMFAAMMSRERNFKNAYAEYWWHLDIGGMGGYDQLVMRTLWSGQSYYASLNDNKVMASTYALDLYFYGHNSDFRELPEMEKKIAGMTDAQMADNEIYVPLARMVRGWRATKAVDLFNSVPYSDALKGTEGQFFPKFDNPVDIYKSVINDLGTLPGELDGLYAGMSSDGKRIFNSQDIIFGGDLMKWKQWASAVRLRLAVRMAGIDLDFSRAAITDILSKGQLPTSDLFTSSAAWINKDGNHWKLGVAERDYAAFVSAFWMYQMDRDTNHVYNPGKDDPRLPVFVMPNRDTVYMPMSYDFLIGDKINTYVRNDNNAKYGYNFGYMRYSYYTDIDRYMKYNNFCLPNPCTFVRNTAPWRAFTAAEVDFLLAEAALFGYASTGNSPENYLKSGVVNSINYWYAQNATSNWNMVSDANRWFLKPAAPDAADVDAFAEIVLNEYRKAGSNEEKLGVIITQKYVHLNIQDFVEVFTELRRTRYPKLPILKFGGSVALKPMIERYPYPGAEAANNKLSLADVADQDNFTSPIFWVIPSRRGVDYYEPGFNDKYFYNRYLGVPESFQW